MPPNASLGHPGGFLVVLVGFTLMDYAPFIRFDRPSCVLPGSARISRLTAGYLDKIKATVSQHSGRSCLPHEEPVRFPNVDDPIHDTHDGGSASTFCPEERPREASAKRDALGKAKPVRLLPVMDLVWMLVLLAPGLGYQQVR
jgi:hypothetical protein